MCVREAKIINYVLRKHLKNRDEQDEGIITKNSLQAVAARLEKQVGD